MTPDEKLETLRSAFPIRYARREDAEEYGSLSWGDVVDRPSEDAVPWVSFESVAKGECAYSQSSTLDRSNFRSLQRDYPNVWTTLSYSNVEVLGAFVADLSEDLITELVGLAHEYPLYDEEDMSALESDEITESWGQYLQADLYNGADERTQETWGYVDGADVETEFWTTLSDSDYWPEHSGYDIRWDDDRLAELLPGIVARVAARTYAVPECPGQTELFDAEVRS